MTKPAHFSVLLQESIEALFFNPDGIYVDGTFGRGGHSRELLGRLSPNGKLIGIDKDPQAIVVGRELEQQDSRFSIVHGSFAELKSIVKERGELGNISGILLDLGVSSPQLDQAERGFSFMQDGPLDMRMNPLVGISAQEWVNQTDEKEIARVLKEYGEERFAKRMARAICTRREERPFERTLDLADVITKANPKWEREKHPATRAFQAIRIEVNNELGDLTDILSDALEVLSVGGRLAVISFHSLEDRIVKRFFKGEARGTQYPKHLPITSDMQDQRVRLASKAIKASEQEVSINGRSRSAVLRVAEKL